MCIYIYINDNMYICIICILCIIDMCTNKYKYMYISMSNIPIYIYIIYIYICMQSYSIELCPYVALHPQTPNRFPAPVFLLSG